MDMTLKRTLLATLAVATFSLTTGLANAVQAKDDDPIAAEVNGQTIRLSEVKDARVLLPAQLQNQPLEVVYPILLDSLINTRLAAEHARALGLDKTTMFQERMARIGEQILERMVLTQQIEEKVTDAALQKRYAALRESSKDLFEVHARHILVDTQDQAKAIVAQLQEGTDFATLAKAESTGPSGPSGGDLGWFAPGRMVAAFEQAAMALEPGSYTPEPVQTQFGWHVIKVEERRPMAAPKFKDVRATLVNELSAELGQTFMEQLRTTATVNKKTLKELNQ